MTRRSGWRDLFLAVGLGLGGGTFVGWCSGLYQVQLNRYAEQHLSHSSAVLVHACVHPGAVLGALGALLFSLAWWAARYPSRLWVRGITVGLLLPLAVLTLRLAQEAFLTQPAFHDMKIPYHQIFSGVRHPWFWTLFGFACGCVGYLIPWPRRALRAVLGGLLCLTSLGAVAYVRAQVSLTLPPAPATRQPNVLFLVIDALRADHVGAYGYERDTTPFIDSLAKTAVLFENAFAPANVTRMSVPSYFASVYPAAHGIRHLNQSSSPSLLMLAELLKNAGYETGAWMPNPSLNPSYNFHYGFDVYFDTQQLLNRSRDEGLPTHERHETASGIQRSVLTWMRERRRTDRPFFAYLHYRDVHGPYAPPPPYDTMYYDHTATPVHPLPRGFDWGHLQLPNDRNDLAYYLAQYDGEIRYTDDQLRRFFAEIRRQGLLENTLIILTADHGEAFLDHGQIGHRTTLYDELVHVPLLVRIPHEEFVARTVASMVELVDLAPTVLDYAGLEIPASFKGHSLRPILQGKSPVNNRTMVFLESPYWVAVRTKDWKLHVHRVRDKQLLYHLSVDPREKHPIPEAEWPAAARILEIELHSHLAAARARQSGGAVFDLSPDLRKRLESLGYVKQ